MENLSQLKTSLKLKNQCTAMTLKNPIFFLLTIILAFTNVVAFGQQKAKKTINEIKPNVLIIVIDDLNDYVSQLKGFPGLKTPNLDKFMKTGMNFSKAYCAAPVCNPSRAALLSGVAPYKSGVYDNINKITDSKVLDSAVFMPELFKANGYTTLTRGKIFHTAPEKSRYVAMWDVDEGKGGYGPMPTERNIPKTVKAPKMFNYQPWTGPETDHPDNITAETVMKQLSREL